MADERKCFAGDLTSDVLGKVIRLRVDGQTVIEDVVINVEHSIGIHGEPVTFVAFENVVARRRIADVAGSSSFVVDHTEEATVLP
jgi:hypothetical protein